MNYAQSFEEFSKNLSATDIVLYIGAALVLWVLFKDRLGPVQKLVVDLFGRVGGLMSRKPATVSAPVIGDVFPDISLDKDNTFYKLIASWKTTRDLAVKSGCEQAVKVADQMFPYLSPNVCKDATPTLENPKQ